MKRATVSEKQRAVELLVALGELSYRQIARQVEVHYNSITAWVRNPQVLALVHEIQKGIQDKMESQALEAVQRKNALLLLKALQKLEDMLDSKSQKKQMEVVKFLLSYGALSGVTDAPQERQSHMRLSPEAQAWLKAHQS